MCECNDPRLPSKEMSQQILNFTPVELMVLEGPKRQAQAFQKCSPYRTIVHPLNS